MRPLARNGLAVQAVTPLCRAALSPLLPPRPGQRQSQQGRADHPAPAHSAGCRSRLAGPCYRRPAPRCGNGRGSRARRFLASDPAPRVQCRSDLRQRGTHPFPPRMAATGRYLRYRARRANRKRASHACSIACSVAAGTRSTRPHCPAKATACVRRVACARFAQPAAIVR